MRPAGLPVTTALSWVVGVAFLGQLAWVMSWLDAPLRAVAVAIGAGALSCSAWALVALRRALSPLRLETNALSGLRSKLADQPAGEPRSLERTRQASAAGGGFLRAIRHELRTPLNAILGLSEVLLAEGDGPLTEGQRENLSIITHSAHRLSALFDDVLELSADAAGERAQSRVPIDVGELLEDVAVALGNERNARAVHVSVLAEPALAPALGDLDAVRRLVHRIARHALSVSSSELLLLRAVAIGEETIRIDIKDPLRVIEPERLAVLCGDEPSTLHRPGLDESARLRLGMFRQLAALSSGTFTLASDATGTRMSITLDSAEPKGRDDAEAGVAR